MYVTVSSSHNLIHDLSGMLNQGIIPRIYFALFETEYQTNLLKRVLNILQLPISGVLLDESLVKLRREDLQENIIKVSKTWGYPVVSLSDIKEQKNVVIIVLNDFNFYHLMINFFEDHQFSCHLFHYTEIKLSNYRLYVPNEKQWDKACGADYYNSHKPGCRIVKNAIIEPTKAEERISDGSVIYKGGVCDENGHFIAGFKRHPKNEKFNWCIYDSYEPKGEIQHLNGDYIWGGVLINHFGHVITEVLVNLWWVVKNKNNKDKIIFIFQNKKVHSSFWKLMELLEIKERIVIVEQLCQVNQIIIPDQSFKMFAEYTDEMRTVYDAISSVILEKPSEDTLYKKIYLTKPPFGRNDIFGEYFFENFYRKKGYEIIAPETLPFETQIRILNHAEEIVCSIGSMSHMLLFSNNNRQKVTFLMRVNEIGGCLPQLMMNQALNVNFDIVDVSMNLLPTRHALGVFLIGPTKHFIKYLNENHISYDINEVQMDWSCLYDYFISYINHYNCDGYLFRRVKDLDMFDVINQLNVVLNGTYLDRNKMQTKSKPQLEKEINDLKSMQNGHAVVKFDYYFAEIGWVDDIENLQQIIKSYPMEAIRIRNPYPDCKIECNIKQHQIGWQSGEIKNGIIICGQTGKALSMTAIRLKVSDGCDNYRILYRAYMKTTGWTRLCRNDEICGSISEESEDCIMGMQIILINDCMDHE